VALVGELADVGVPGAEPQRGLDGVRLVVGASLVRCRCRRLRPVRSLRARANPRPTWVAEPGSSAPSYDGATARPSSSAQNCATRAGAPTSNVTAIRWEGMAPR